MSFECSMLCVLHSLFFYCSETGYCIVSSSSSDFSGGFLFCYFLFFGRDSILA